MNKSLVSFLIGVGTESPEQKHCKNMLASKINLKHNHTWDTKQIEEEIKDAKDSDLCLPIISKNKIK